MRPQKDITDQFDEIDLTIVGEEIFGLNGDQPGDGSKEAHICVFMLWLF
jgi:hypothetical protein